MGEGGHEGCAGSGRAPLLPAAALPTPPRTSWAPAQLQ